jgi:uncharacterized protein YceH (UPF0502 family)
MDGLPLNEAEIRVLGSLIEKDITTPEYYPLSLNALTNACNQINNRDPVVDYGEQTVSRAIDSLRTKRLAFALTGAESRVLKFGHKATETLELPRPELSVLCVLLLRGPQTVGEIRGRTGRMHEFKSLEEVQAVLQALASRPEPLVTVLPRQAGTKEPRYAQLLGGAIATAPVAAEPPAPEPAAVDSEKIARLEAEIATLRSEVAGLKQQFAEFRKQFE